MKKRLKAIIYTVRLEVWQSIMLGAQLLIIFVLLGNIFIYFICGEIVGKENSNIVMKRMVIFIINYISIVKEARK